MDCHQQGEKRRSLIMESMDDIANEMKNEILMLEKNRAAVAESLVNIERITEPISYEEFLEKFMIPNVPVILSKWATENWCSCSKWVTQDGNAINWCELQTSFGDSVVPVVNCSNSMDYYYQEKEDKKFVEFAEYMRSVSSNGDDVNKPLMYLKDWHFVRDFPAYPAYSVPVYFKSDWLNEFWECRNECSDDYRFVYIGPKGSWTPFHADVLRSHSWSANVCGRKRWIIYAPGHENLLRKNHHGNLPSDVEFIGHDSAARKSSKRFDVVQEAGEVIFVPSGWHHQVFNLEDTISINHNWINGYNVDISWSYVKERLKDVESEIFEHRNMEGWSKQCQLILRADCGMDFVDFFNFMFFISSKRMKFLNDLTEKGSADTNGQCDVTGEQCDNVINACAKCNSCKGIEYKQDASFQMQSIECQQPTDNSQHLHSPYYLVNDRTEAVFDLNKIRMILTDMISNISIKDCLSDTDRISCNPNKLYELINNCLACHPMSTG